MYKIVFSLLCFLWTGSASAFTCPDFFRFVDFGQTDHDGIVYRGGSFFRAEDFDGTALLHIERTECLDVTDIGKDGHGNPIPVVVSIHYNPDNLPADFAELNVRSLEDATAAAEESAERHRTRLQQPDIETTRGENYLCLTDNTKELFSCQVTSPFAENGDRPAGDNQPYERACLDRVQFETQSVKPPHLIEVGSANQPEWVPVIIQWD